MAKRGRPRKFELNQDNVYKVIKENLNEIESVSDFKQILIRHFRPMSNYELSCVKLEACVILRHRIVSLKGKANQLQNLVLELGDKEEDDEEEEPVVRSTSVEPDRKQLLEQVRKNIREIISKGEARYKLPPTVPSTLLGSIRFVCWGNNIKIWVIKTGHTWSPGDRRPPRNWTGRWERLAIFILQETTYPSLSRSEKIRYKDGNPFNCVLENLLLENKDDKIKHCSNCRDRPAKIGSEFCIECSEKRKEE